MNWLSFFIGMTSAWVGMGVFITLFQLTNFRGHNQSKAESQLLKFWETSELYKKLELEKLTRIEQAINSLRETI